jgi:hypothetical protein
MADDNNNLEHIPWKPGEFVLDERLDYNLLGLACVNAIRKQDATAYENVFNIIEVMIVTNSYLDAYTKITNKKE